MSYFITFEGGEGTGKTTIIKELDAYFKTKKYEVVETREPGGIEIAEQIRKIILDVNNKNMDYRTEALLYAASRAQHLAEKIIPALENNKVVLCDRYIDSSLVYQGIARGLGIDNVLAINKFALNYMPNMTFLIDVEPKVCFQRLKDVHREMDRLDLESMNFHETVYKGYLQVADMYKDRIVKIDGHRSLEEIIEDIKRHIDKLIGE